MTPDSRIGDWRKPAGILKTTSHLFRLARLQFLIAGLALFVFGTAWAVLLGAPFSLPRALLGYLVFLPAHLSISFSNDYFDQDVDKHGEPTLFSGGSGVLVNHPGLGKPAKWIAITLILCSQVLGFVFQRVYAYPIWFSGFLALCNLLGWFYSAPPLRLSYRGFGELAMILAVGLLIPGWGYLVTNGSLDQDGLLFSIPLILYGLAFILAVEIPDLESDLLGGKRTWVVRIGRRRGFTIIGVSLLLATSFFFCFQYLTSRTYRVDFRFLGSLSLLPLGAGWFGWIRRPLEKQPAARIVAGILIAYAVFCLLADGYLIYLSLCQRM